MSVVGSGGARLVASLGLALALASCAVAPPAEKKAPVGSEMPAILPDEPRAVAPAPTAGTARTGTPPADPPADPPARREPVAAPRSEARSDPRESSRPAEPPRLEDLIRAEEARHAASGADPRAKRNLATLYALSGRYADAYKLLDGVDLGKDDFLRLVFAAASDQVNEHQAAMAALEGVRAGWRTIHPLRIPFAAFCTAARGFQDYTRYAKDEFEPGQVVGIYFELDEFASRQGAGGEYEVSVHTEAEVLTPAPNSQVIRLPDAEHYAQDLNRRTARPLEDLCLGLRVRLPRNLITGAYQLRLTVEDRLAQKKAQTLIEFRIK